MSQDERRCVKVSINTQMLIETMLKTYHFRLTLVPAEKWQWLRMWVVCPLLRCYIKPLYCMAQSSQALHFK